MTTLTLRRAIAALTSVAITLPVCAQMALPVAPVRNVPETFFGTTVDDPYRDFENVKAPTVAAWMKAHSDHAHSTLKRINGRAELRNKIERYDSSAAARVTGVVRLPADLYFNERRGPKDDQFKLYMQRGLNGSA